MERKFDTKVVEQGIRNKLAMQSRTSKIVSIVVAIIAEASDGPSQAPWRIKLGVIRFKVFDGGSLCQGF